MSKVLAYLDGENVAICFPVLSEAKENETEEFYLKRIRAKDIPAQFSGSVLVLDSSDLPKTNLFRDAWEISGGCVRVNMKRAAQIHMDAIRAARDSKLSSLDRDEMAAFSMGDQTKLSSVREAKQRLRDLPVAFSSMLETASSPEALDSMWPDILDRSVDGDDR